MLLSQLSQQYKVPLVNNLYEGLDKKVYIDKLHANEVAQPIIRNTVWLKLVPLIGLF